MTEEEKLWEALKRWEEKYCHQGETERVDESTPSGGDYSIAYYYDAEHRPCKKVDACWVDIVEYKADGTFVNSILGFCENNR